MKSRSRWVKRLSSALILVFLFMAAGVLNPASAASAQTTSESVPASGTALPAIATTAAPTSTGSTAATPAASAGAPAAATVTPAFPDVSQADPNLLYINYLASRHLVSGYPDGTFHPDSGLTRAEAATLLVKASGLQPASGPASFSDVPAGYWAGGSIAAATVAGLVYGYPDGAFRPEAFLTRAEGAALFTNLIRQPNEATLPSLSDVSPDNWAAKAIALALAAGMIETSAPGQFSPNDPLTRSDLARVLGVILTEDPDYNQAALTGALKPLTGTVQLTTSGATTPATVTGPTPIAEGDTITTGAGSSAEIDFPDASSLLLKENTSLTVKKMQGKSRLLWDGTAGTAIAWLELGMTQGQLFGALASSYEKSGSVQPVFLQGLRRSPARAINLADDESAASSLPWYQAGAGEQVQAQVDMAWGDAGIEGTVWHIIKGQQMITISVADGLVQVTSNSSQSVQVPAGLQTDLTGPGAPPAPPSAMSNAEISDWQSQPVQTWLQQVANAIQAQINPNSDTVATAIINAVNSAVSSFSPLPTPPPPGPVSSSGGGGGGISYTGSISSVALNSPTGTAGTAQTITVNVTTENVPDGTTVTADLLDKNGNVVASISGAIIGNAATLDLPVPAGLPAGSYTIQVTVTGVPSYSTVYTVSSNLTITPSTIAAAVLGQPYSQAFSASGGTGSYVFSESGGLATGLFFSNGAISGTATEPGAFPITLTATDSNQSTGTASYTLIVKPLVKLH